MNEVITELRELARRILKRAEVAQRNGHEDAWEAYTECAKMISRRADTIADWEKDED
jgi:hypothetical protein